MVEPGETAAEAAEREAREEAGLKVSAARFVGLFDSTDRDGRGNVSAAYVCETVDGEQAPEPGEGASEADSSLSTAFPKASVSIIGRSSMRLCIVPSRSVAGWLTQNSFQKGLRG
ncbi:MAG: ADP-ribose pyrophosphatase [Methanonatronarchaeales archaeon]|nr:ADP-ribose pyrophosphatase [Methanonatronarchaeales archaeon]